MNICFCILCILCFISPCNIFLKIMIGTMICILFSMVLKNTNMMREFAHVLIVACLMAINFVVLYVRSDFLCLRNGIIIALLLNCIMSVYILCVLMLIAKIKGIFRLE